MVCMAGLYCRMKTFRILCCCLLLAGLIACDRKTVRVGLLVGSEESVEVDSLMKVLHAGSENQCRIISFADSTDFSNYDLIWYHRPDSTGLTQQEILMGAPLKRYVERRGQLVLPMEAVRLLNAWNMEPTPIKAMNYHAVDEGFGRKVGFHGYRENIHYSMA